MVMGNHATLRRARDGMPLADKVASDASGSGPADTTLRKYWASYQRRHRSCDHRKGAHNFLLHGQFQARFGLNGCVTKLSGDPAVFGRRITHGHP